MPGRIGLRVTRPDRTLVTVIVIVDEVQGPPDRLEHKSWDGVFRPLPLSPADTVDLPALLDYLDNATRFAPADGSVRVNALVPQAMRLLILLGVRDPIPDLIPVELTNHA